MKGKSFLKNKSLFRMAFLTNVFFFSVHFLQYASYIGIVLLILWGIGLLIADIKNGNIKKVYFHKFFVLFLAIGVVSHIINLITGDGRAFPSVVGAVLLIITAIFMFLFVPNKDTKKGTIERELYYVAKIYFYSTLICNIVGIILLLVFKDSLGERIIIYDNRFVGAYINPNMGAFDCFLSIVSGLIISNKKFCSNIGKKPINKWSCLFVLLLSYFVIAISDSKGALLALLVFLMSNAVFCVYKAVVKRENKTHILPAVISVVALAVALFAVTPCQQIMSAVCNSTSLSLEVKAQSKTQEDSEKSDAGITFDHEEEKEQGGGGRITLYKQSLKFFSEKPIFGWGCGNMLLMGESTQANTIDNLQFDLGTKLFEPHNGYLTILATSGITGFVVFISFVLIAVWTILKSTFKKVKYGGIGKTAFVTSCVLALLAYALVEPSLVYYPSIVVSMFWFLIGAAFKWAAEHQDKGLKIPSIV